MDTSGRSNVVALNGTNFPTWKIQIRMLLMKQGVWKIVDGTEVAPIDNMAALSKFNDRRDKALSTLVLAVEPSLLYLLGDPQDPVDVWKKLCDQFQKKSWSNKLILRRKLLSLKPKENESIQNHIKAMLETFDALSVIGEAVEEEDRVVHILASLPDRYNMLVTAFEASSEVPKLEVVTEKLMNEERKLLEKNGSRDSNQYSSSHDALFTNGQNRSKYVPPNCYYCGESGHIKRNCEEWKRKQEETQEVSKQPAVANFSYVNRRKGRADSESSDDEVECIALISEERQESQSKWVVDSAATNHMCKDRNSIRNLKRLKKSKNVKVGNGEYVQAQFEGTVKLKVRSGSKMTVFKLCNVLFVPELKYNLLSVSKASQAKKKVQFDQQGCKIIDMNSEEILGEATRVGNLYCIDIAKKSDIKRANLGNLCRNDMEKAIASIRENSFKQEIMARLNLVEEDKTRMNNRLNVVEEDINSNPIIIKEENTDQNQEDTNKEVEVQHRDMISEEINIQEDILGEVQDESNNRASDKSSRSDSPCIKKGQEQIQIEDIEHTSYEETQGRTDKVPSIKSRLSALKKSCSKFLRRR